MFLGGVEGPVRCLDSLVMDATGCDVSNPDFVL